MSAHGLDPGSSSGGGGSGRQGSINDQMLHIQVLVPIEVEYAMNFRDELEAYLKLFPKLSSQEVTDYFMSTAKPAGLNDEVIQEMLRKRLAKREAAKPSETKDSDGEKYFLLGIAGVGTNTFVGFYTDKMMEQLSEINRELTTLKLELEQADSDPDDAFSTPAEDLATIRVRIGKLERERQEIYSKSNKLGRELALQNNTIFTKFVAENVKPVLTKFSVQTGMLFSKVHQKPTGKHAVVIWTDNSLKPTQSTAPKIQG